MNFEQWGSHFESSGPTVGEQVPDARLFDADGRTIYLQSLWQGKCAVLVSGSITCPIARTRLPEFATLAKPLEDRFAMGMLYCLEPHPQGDPAPHRPGEEWITDENENDGLLFRQPHDLPTRLTLARKFHLSWGTSYRMYVDTMDNQLYNLFGTAPCMGLLIDGGRIVCKQGWLEPDQMIEQVEALLGI